MSAQPPQTVSSQSAGARAISRAAFKVGAGGILSLAVGFLSQMLIAALYGADVATDAYWTAATLPFYIQSVLLASLAFVMIPAFVAEIEAGRPQDAWRLVRTLWQVVSVILVIIVVILVIWAADVIRLQAPGLDADKAALAVQMVRILSASILFSGLQIFSTGVLNAQDRFFLPSFSGAVYSAVNIGVLWVLFRPLGPLALAWATLVAAAVQAAMTFFPVARRMRHGALSLRDPRIVEMGRLMLPFLLLALVTRITPLVERYFASGLPDGDLSYLGYADKVMRIFQGLLSTTIVTAVFPTLSRSYARKGLDGLLSTFQYGLRLSLVVALPIVTIGSAVSLPLVSVIFERGAFTYSDTLAVARIIPLVLIRVIFIAMIGNLLTRVFYVTRDTWTPSLVSAVLSIPVYIVSAAWMSVRWGYVGLAVADIVYSGIGLLALILLLSRRYRGRIWAGIPGRFIAYVAASIAGGALAWAIVGVLSDMPALVQLTAASLGASLFYLGALWMIDHDVALAVLDMIGITYLTRQSMQRIRQMAQSGTSRP